jgi:hypothetical protein
MDDLSLTRRALTPASCCLRAAQPEPPRLCWPNKHTNSPPIIIIISICISVCEPRHSAPRLVGVVAAMSGWRSGLADGVSPPEQRPVGSGRELTHPTGWRRPLDSARCLFCQLGPLASAQASCGAAATRPDEPRSLQRRRRLMRRSLCRAPTTTTTTTTPTLEWPIVA